MGDEVYSPYDRSVFAVIISGADFQQYSGSAVVVAMDKEIVTFATAAHVLAYKTSAGYVTPSAITLQDRLGNDWVVHVQQYGFDSEKDLAVFSVAKTELPEVIPLPTADATYIKNITAVGFPAYLVAPEGNTALFVSHGFPLVNTSGKYTVSNSALGKDSYYQYPAELVVAAMLPATGGMSGGAIVQEDEGKWLVGIVVSSDNENRMYGMRVNNLRQLIEQALNGTANKTPFTQTQVTAP
jgi:S1-C subfamily serine protease